MKLLVVEDEVKTADYLRQGLMGSGFVVDLACKGLDGWRIAQALREAKSPTPVLRLAFRPSVRAVLSAGCFPSA